MDQKQRLDYLVEKFKEDSGEYRNLKVSDNDVEKRRILRSLMNIRMPRHMDEEILKVQDEFLKEDAREKGIVTLNQIPTVKRGVPQYCAFCGKKSLSGRAISPDFRWELSSMQPNSQMLGCFVPCHRCIDNAIHSAAGVELRAECSRQMNQKRIRYGRSYEEPTGQAMVTGGYNLPAEHVIHTVGPIVYCEVTDKLRQV